MRFSSLILAVLAPFVFAFTAVVGQDSNGQAVARLRSALQNDYSYRDLRGVDWEQQVSKFETRLRSSKDANEFAKTAAELLSDAKDIHIWLTVGKQTMASHSNESQLNFNPRVIPSIVGSLKQHGKTVLEGKIGDQIRYVLFSTWDHREPNSMHSAIDVVRESARNQTPLIIDVRPNAGGDEIQAREVAAMFVKLPKLYATHRNYVAGNEGELQRRILDPDPQGVFHSGPCVVLMGPKNMSSCESFLLMMRAAGIRLVGMKSMGASGNPKPHDLGNGVTLFLPSWRNLDAQQKAIEGTGIQPDVEVLTNSANFSNADPVLRKATELLSSKP